MSLFHIPQGEFTRALGQLRRVFTHIGLFSLVINLLLLAPSLYMLQTYDRVLTSRNEGTLVMLTLLLAGLLALEAALEYLRSLVMSRASAAVDVQMGPQLFNAAFAQRLSGQGSLSQTLNDLGHVRGFVTGRGLMALFDAPWLPVFLLVTFLIHPVLGWFGVVSAAFLLGLAWYNEHATGTLQAEAGRMGNAATHMADASARNAEVVDALGMLGALRERWLVRQHHYLATLGDVNQRAARIGAAVKFSRSFLQSGILGLGAYLVLKDQVTPGGMIAASILLSRALAPVDMVIAHWRQLVTAREALQRLNGLMAQPVVYPPDIKLPRPQGFVQVENLVVAAPAGANGDTPNKREPILKGLGFEVAAGQQVAIVGPSGSGKSTLARALMGVWKPLAGSVRLDGADLGSAYRDDIGPYLGYLPQDIELFAGTLAENIARFGVIDSDAVVQAAQRAGVHELILRMPKGYETRIQDGSPGSVTLSGGQRQRIALARALYGDPVLVVLDEPNASLDEAGDQALMQALRDLKARGRTVFVVTHRMNLLTQVDTIMVLNDGRIQVMGASEDILKANQQRVGQPPHTAGSHGERPKGIDGQPAGESP
ncbi:type I secretion system permease/ATPase [Hydrogenophaga atypica]|uniref:Type I secretion system permease/ATPase n=1 Tax=Hydrogenophaga atypica TaxID=249409 RepID=A0ABW2QQE9_9BURK